MYVSLEKQKKSNIIKKCNILNVTFLNVSLVFSKCGDFYTKIVFSSHIAYLKSQRFKNASLRNLQKAISVSLSHIFQIYNFLN